MASNIGYEVTNDEELRIVLLGKTGAGKSATGNTILGEKHFLSKLSAISLTEKCSKKRSMVDGQKVAVIDTPGLLDTRFGKEKTLKDLSQCISYAAPGPHVFLVVIRLGRYTEEEMKTVQKIQEIFGPAADRYSMVLFTGGDDLDDDERPIHEFVMESPDLKELVNRCNGQYHVFNNKQKDPSQVTELLTKIRSIVLRNGGSHYTNEMFQEAEMILEQEKQHILKEREEEIIKEKEELKKQMEEKFQKEIEEINKKSQLEKEREKRERAEKKREEQRRNEERERRGREKMKKKVQRMKEKIKSESQKMRRERKERKKQQKETEKRAAEEERQRKEMEENMNRRFEELERKMSLMQSARQEAEDLYPALFMVRVVQGFISAGAAVYERVASVGRLFSGGIS